MGHAAVVLAESSSVVALQHSRGANVTPGRYLAATAYVTRWYAMRYDLPVAAYHCLAIGLMLRHGHKRR